MTTRKKNDSVELPEVSVSDDGEVRHLHLGTPWIQGSMRLKEPFALELEYVQRMMAWLLFAGGGAVLMREQLARRYPHCRFPDHPQFANARGMLKIAKYVFGAKD